MNEDETNYSPITLPEVTEEQKAVGINAYDLLNEAHDEDVAAGGDNNASGKNEEKMYPTAVSQADNSRSYRNEMTKANTRELLEELKSSLKPEPESKVEEAKTKSLFNIRTGSDKQTEASLGKRIENREEIFATQDKQAEKYKEFFTRINTVVQIDYWIGIVDGLIKDGKMREDQRAEIIEVAENKRIELQNKVAEKYKEFFTRIDTVAQIDYWIGIVDAMIEDAVIENGSENGRMREDQRAEIIEVAENKRIELQNKVAEKYKEFFTRINTVVQIDYWIGIVDGLIKDGKMREDQRAKINNVAENRKAEINEGIGNQK